MNKHAYAYVMKTAQEKQAFIGAAAPPSFWESAANKLVRLAGPMKALSSIASGGLVLKMLYDKINNDVTRKAILEDLSLNDPILKNIPKPQLLEWYATIYKFSPRASSDKTAVREILQSFAKFGKVDMQTLKLLSDIEENMRPKNDTWGNVLL